MLIKITLIKLITIKVTVKAFNISSVKKLYVNYLTTLLLNNCDLRNLNNTKGLLLTYLIIILLNNSNLNTIISIIRITLTARDNII